MKKYMVIYIDDFYKKHMAFVTSMAEVNFIRGRFDLVEIQTLAATAA